jgi:hypothetical protein
MLSCQAPGFADIAPIAADSCRPPSLLRRHLPAQTHSNILPGHPTCTLISTPDVDGAEQELAAVRRPHRLEQLEPGVRAAQHPQAAVVGVDRRDRLIGCGGGDVEDDPAAIWDQSGVPGQRSMARPGAARCRRCARRRGHVGDLCVVGDACKGDAAAVGANTGSPSKPPLVICLAPDPSARMIQMSVYGSRLAGGPDDKIGSWAALSAGRWAKRRNLLAVCPSW